MAIKVALLVIAALIAVAATYPSAAITSKELFYPDCNEHTIHEATLLGEPIELKICSKHGKKCVVQDPFITECPVPRPPQCTHFKWLDYDKDLAFNAYICHHPWKKGLCYQSKKSLIRCGSISDPLPGALLQQVEEWTEENDVEICEIINNGVKQCRSLSEGRKAKVSEVDCFCATDVDSGNKVCFPDDCDEGFPDSHDV